MKTYRIVKKSHKNKNLCYKKSRHSEKCQKSVNVYVIKSHDV